MNVNDRLTALRDLIQEDVGNRGLRGDPAANLISACADDFANACHSIAVTSGAGVAVVTGFFIPHGEPPAGETDGPLGAVFLARALNSLGIRVVLITDSFCRHALEQGLASCGLDQAVRVVTIPPSTHPWDVFLQLDWQQGLRSWFPLTHLVALERVGPSHTVESWQAQLGPSSASGEARADFLRAVPPDHQDHCHSMRGRDITDHTCPAHLLFEAARRQEAGVTTIGIGDGGNEIGMGKIAWDVIRRNIPNGGLIACRVPTDYLIVAGVSNWGAYALAAGVALLKGKVLDPGLFDVERERALLRVMVEQGPLVDGVSGKPTVTVDGLSFERYGEPLKRLNAIVDNAAC